MQLDGVDTKPLGASCGIDECIAHAGQSRRIKRQRRSLALLVRHRGWSLCLPTTLGDGNLLAAVPRLMARRLAAGMGELYRYRCLGMFAYRNQDRLQCGFRGVVIEAKTSRRDAADGLHVGGLDAEHRRARQRERVDMREVPVVGLPVHGGILAHRRHHDAIGKFKAAQLYRRKQGTHEGFPGRRKERRCSSI